MAEHARFGQRKGQLVQLRDEVDRREIEDDFDDGFGGHDQCPHGGDPEKALAEPDAAREPHHPNGVIRFVEGSREELNHLHEILNGRSRKNHVHQQRHDLGRSDDRAGVGRDEHREDSFPRVVVVSGRPLRRVHLAEDEQEEQRDLEGAHDHAEAKDDEPPRRPAAALGSVQGDQGVAIGGVRSDRVLEAPDPFVRFPEDAPALQAAASSAVADVAYGLVVLLHELGPEVVEVLQNDLLKPGIGCVSPRRHGPREHLIEVIFAGTSVVGNRRRILVAKPRRFRFFGHRGIRVVGAELDMIDDVLLDADFLDEFLDAGFLVAGIRRDHGWVFVCPDHDRFDVRCFVNVRNLKER
mmetsp:Transcript_86/g.201  ORF Transcript_86/g.201 Transcript_86/m.201 type:complete len:353 (+) Transcript_86:2309-3367(+)